MKWILQILTLFYPKQYFIPMPDELNEMNPANALLTLFWPVQFMIPMPEEVEEKAKWLLQHLQESAHFNIVKAYYYF